MSIAQTRITQAEREGKGVVGLADTPGLTTEAMQAKFDELAVELLIPKHNALVEALGAPDGADGIGAAGDGSVQDALAARARVDEVLTKGNVEPFTPTGDYQPATKKYVDDAMFNAGAADMRTAVYDADADGVVDDAQRLGGQLPGFYGKAPARYEAVLTGEWEGEAAPYTQTVTVAGIAESDAPHIAPVYDQDAATAKAQRAAWGCVCAAKAGEGSVSFTCFEEKPEAAVPVFIEVLR